MERKEFLKKGFASLGMMVIAPIVLSCKTTNEAVVDTGSGSATGSTNGSSANDCTVNPSETEGPFPTHSPNSYVRNDIRAGSAGLDMIANITIKNKNTGCGALAGVTVDIWHCDADGNYSEYGGSGMQPTNYTSVHFLRGRQTTDANGLASFTTIFPGWYNGRAVHIHVHVYDSKGKSLLVTQIAFPATICDSVYTEATSFYKKGKSTTSNQNDNVFSDGVTTQLAGVKGSIKEGFTLTHNIVVSA